MQLPGMLCTSSWLPVVPDGQQLCLLAAVGRKGRMASDKHVGRAAGQCGLLLSNHCLQRGGRAARGYNQGLALARCGGVNQTQALASSRLELGPYP